MNAGSDSDITTQESFTEITTDSGTEIGTTENGTVQVGTTESGTTEIGTTENVTVEIGTTESGTTDVSTINGKVNRKRENTLLLLKASD